MENPARGVVLEATAWLALGVLGLGVLSSAAVRGASGPRPGDDQKDGAEKLGLEITGRVLDDESRPIAGARVARGSDLRGREKVPEATTDAEGRFSMAGVPAGPLVLTAQAPGQAPELKTMTVEPGLAPVEFRLGPGHTIRGRIVDVHDKPIAGAPIAADQWRGHHSLRWSTRTDAEGRFRWDEAPADVVMIDLGQLGFKGKRFYSARPDAPEWTLPMRRPLRVRGRVTDAGTGRPVRPFTVVPGYAFDESGRVSWENGEAKEVSGLSYDETLSTTYPLRLIRVEADGYLPAVSRRMKDDEEEVVLHFALERGTGVEGVVRGPEGSPVAGADVLLATTTRPVYLNNGRAGSSGGGQRIVRSRADGRFSLPVQEPPYTILALHDRGLALREVKDRPTAPAELTLRPWGRVEGTLRFGSRPGARQQLALWENGPPGEVTWSGFARTDAEGRFVFDRVAPGPVNISLQIAFGHISSAGGSPTVNREVAAGETLRLDLGGTGRPIVGKAVPPAELAGRKDWMYGTGYLIRQPTDAAGKAKEPAGLPGPSFVFRAEPDGTFRIEDIEAGTYEIRIVAVRRPADGQFRFGAEVLAAVHREVIVPPIPGGLSDEPLDLGEITVAVEKGPDGAPQQGKP